MQRLSRPGLVVSRARWWCVAALGAATTQASVGSGLAGAQDSTPAPPVSALAPGGGSPGGGPLIFTETAADGHWVDAQDAPTLQRRVTIMLIGVPLASALEAITAQAGVSLSYAPESLPIGARISIKARDTTLVAVLRQMLANTGQDVLVRSDGDLMLVPHDVVVGLADSSHVITGSVLDAATGEPVPYATVALLGTGHARFTDADGRFRLARLTPRAYILRARQIGYRPVDTTVVVGRSPAVSTLALRIRRTPILLGAVTITGRRGRGCRPGIPDPQTDPTLGAIFEQVRENVARTQLLSEQYPFRYTQMERRVIRRTPGGDSTEYIDSLSFDSRARRPYRAGDVLFYRLDTVFHRAGPGDFPTPVVRRHMYLPTFSDLADSTFLAAHCFSLGAIERGRSGEAMYRIDFAPVPRIATPDVEGSIYIDARDLLVRRAFFALTRPEAARPPVLNFSVTTTFRPIVPLVPLVDSIGSAQLMATAAAYVDPARAVSRLALTTDLLVSVAFEMEAPEAHAPAAVAASPAPSMSPASQSPAEPVDAGRDVSGITRVHAVFPADSSCTVQPPADTIASLVYARLRPAGPLHMRQAGWTQYARRVLLAVRRSFVPPRVLILPTFSGPFAPAAWASVARAGGGIAASAADDTGAPPPGADTSGTFLGVVLGSDPAGLRPLPFVALWLGRGREGVTDTAGSSRLTGLVPGTYALRVRGVGYVGQDTAVVVRAGPAVTIDTVRLTRAPLHRGSGSGGAGHVAQYVAPTFFMTAQLTLGPDGVLHDGRIAVSSGSAAVDTLVLAAVGRAAARRDFPATDSAGARADTVAVDLDVSMAEGSTDEGMALGRVEEAVWPWGRDAALDRQQSQPDMFGDIKAGDPLADTATLEIVVDARGRALPATALVLRTGSRRGRAGPSALERRVLRSLSRFSFTPAVVGSCPVSQLITQGFGYELRPGGTR